MPRLFVGLEIPPEVQQPLSFLRGGLPGARWIDPENYHLTLRFIGDVDDDVAHEVASLLGRVRRGPGGHCGGCPFRLRDPERPGRVARPGLGPPP